MEKKNKRAVIVGAFVLFGLVIFVLGVMTLGGQRNVFTKGTVIHAVFNEVSGLQSGNNVWYAGVKIGTVQAITFTKQNDVNVEMRIEESALSMIKTDTKAKIGSEGFIGNKIVVLYGGSEAAPVVQTGSSIQTMPSLGADEIMATLQQNNQNILAITNDLKTMTTRIMDGQGTVGKLIKNDDLYRDLQTTMASLKIASAEAQNAVANVTNYTDKLSTKGSLASDLVSDTVVFSRLRSTAKQLEALSQRAGQVVANLSATTQNVTQSLNNPSTPAGLLLNDRQTATQIKETIENLQTSSQKLDENLEALQHNFLLRGFFRKKEKSQ